MMMMMMMIGVDPSENFSEVLISQIGVQSFGSVLVSQVGAQSWGEIIILINYLVRSVYLLA